MTTSPRTGQARQSIRDIIAQKGLRQVDVAEILGCDRSSVSRKMYGKVPWTLPEMELLAAAWEVTLNELLGVEPSPRVRDRVSAALPTAGVRRGQTSAGPTHHPKQPSQPDLNGGRKRPKATTP